MWSIILLIGSSYIYKGIVRQSKSAESVATMRIFISMCQILGILSAMGGFELRNTDTEPIKWFLDIQFEVIMPFSWVLNMNCIE